ncbi:hypothetical protein OESDEN_03076 [Oesophagostomum dentatum]|uniref:UPAR/Ly6 domain-containing protein n=1 Tax=Oesophagostomum dentatum TaxID=61180 RepID=A0A0B1TM86_OESDE|nr:hypothetical protein OESDEN_03076 [Oesophagostomum dentatum]
MPPPIEPVQSNKEVLRCLACVESGINDPTVDCSSSAPAACSIREEFCLTKQAQNDDGSFTMEKGCIARAALTSLMDSSDVKMGCATASGGMVNYCVCQGDLCNKESLLSQAQVTGVRKSESPSKPKAPTVERLPEVEAPKPKTPSVDMPTVFLDNDDAPKTDTATVPELRITDEERELMARQKEWAEADLTGACSAFFTVLIPLILAVILL